MYTQKSLISIDKKKLELLITSVRDGLPIRIACERAGIPYYYYLGWLRVYNEFIDAKEKEGKLLEDCKELLPLEYTNKKQEKGYYYTPISLIDTLKKSYGEFISDLAKTVRSGVKDRWQSAAWMLERRCRAEYNKDEQPEERKTVQAVKIAFVDPQVQKERLDALLEEVKKNVGSPE